MIAKLLLIFTIIPIIELSILIPMGQHLGTLPTLGLIIVTATAGAVLGKVQGANAWKRIKEELAHGELPGDSLLDGLAVLVASALLITPGLLSDITGLALLIPFTRAPIRRFARKRLDAWLAKEQVGFLGGGFDGGFGGYDPYVDDRHSGVVFDEGAHMGGFSGGMGGFSGGMRGEDDVIIDVTPRTKENKAAEESVTIEAKPA